MGKPRLLAVVWYITRRCNLKCDFCYTNSDPSQPIGLHKKYLLSIVEQLNNSSVKHLSITGGEPFIRNELKDIITALNSDISINIDTNGVFIPDKWEKIYDDRVNQVCIGIDGPPRLHDIHRAESTKVIEAIRFLQDRDVKIGAPVVITKDNFKHISEIVRYLISLGINTISFNKAKPIGRGAKNTQLLLTEEEEKEVLLKIREVIREYSSNRYTFKFNGWYNTTFFDVLGEKYLPSCYCGYWRAAITPEGDFVPCSLLSLKEYLHLFKRKYKIPNLLKDDLNTSFAESKIFDEYRNATVKYLPENCANCKYKNRCNHGCRTIALVETGSLYGRDPVCKVN